jgi:hypothetical protein
MLEKKLLNKVQLLPVIDILAIWTSQGGFSAPLRAITATFRSFSTPNLISPNSSFQAHEVLRFSAWE